MIRRPYSSGRSRAAGAKGRRRRSAPHVVVVESHADTRELYAEALTWFGFRVTALAAPADACTTLRNDPPSALITNLRRAGTTGPCICDKLRRKGKTPRIPVIAMSTWRPDQERAINQGCFAAVLMKPCLPDELLQVVRTVLRGS